MASEHESSEKTSLAAAASDRIRAIVDAAEQTAATIRADAEEEAKRILADAEEHATGIRSQARTELDALLDSIRSRTNQLSADFEELEAKLKGADAGSPEPAAADPSTAATPAPEPHEPPEATEPTQPTEPTEASEPEPAPAAAAEPDLESARLVALNMALDGADREEVDQYLRENFELSDPKTLLDEVFASVGI